MGRGRPTVPYHAQETFFHWANKDQHYVKSGDTFRDYAFTVEAVGGPYHVRFVLAEASVPPGNTKGETRFFFPVPKNVLWDAEAKTLRIPFEYRLPIEQEVERFGKNSKGQEAILEAAVPRLLEAVPSLALCAVLAQPEDKKDDREISRLERRLRHFSRRRTSDYVIHKDLAGFLKRELEFYLKDQVLHLGDLEGDLVGKSRVLLVVKRLAEDIITFLAQIEEVQKRLFERRKFVLRADYLVPIKEVPRELWKEVLQNKAQLAEWKRLFAIEPKKDLYNKTGKVNLQFLDEHPTLVVNTALFGADFTNRLLSAFEDLEEVTDGLLIHSENYQALRLLQRNYERRIMCIYIDPPYNTGSDEFLYKDRYQHSTWLAMMGERLRLSWHFLNSAGGIFVSIDDSEEAYLREVLRTVFGPSNFVGVILWQKRYSRDNRPVMGTVHDYIQVFAKTLNEFAAARNRIPPDEESLAVYRNPHNDPRGRWRPIPMTAQGFRPNQMYPITTPTGVIHRPPAGRCWSMIESEYLDLLKQGRIWFWTGC